MTLNASNFLNKSYRYKYLSFPTIVCMRVRLRLCVCILECYCLFVIFNALGLVVFLGEFLVS